MSGAAWTAAELAYLSRHYGDVLVADMHFLLERHSAKAIRIKANRMGLRSTINTSRLPQEFYDQILSEYGSATSGQIAMRRRVSRNTVDSWIRRARKRAA